jgi:hypothetical protein
MCRAMSGEAQLVGMLLRCSCYGLSVIASEAKQSILPPRKYVDGLRRFARNDEKISPVIPGRAQHEL